MVELAVEMCIAQCKAGRHCVFEHPAESECWNLLGMERLRSVLGMRYAEYDMSSFGMAVEIDGKA